MLTSRTLREGFLSSGDETAMTGDSAGRLQHTLLPLFTSSSSQDCQIVRQSDSRADCHGTRTCADKGVRTSCSGTIRKPASLGETGFGGWRLTRRRKLMLERDFRYLGKFGMLREDCYANGSIVVRKYPGTSPPGHFSICTKRAKTCFYLQSPPRVARCRLCSPLLREISPGLSPNRTPGMDSFHTQPAGTV